MIIHRGVEADKRLKPLEAVLLSHDLPMFIQRFDGRKCGPVVSFCALLPLLNVDKDGDQRLFGVWQSLN